VVRTSGGRTTNFYFMNKLVSFGCSYTYGHGLKDCYIPPDLAGTQPSVYAWPTLVAQHFQAPCQNLSRPGSSNYEILTTLLTKPIDPDSTVLIQWTTPERDMVITSQGQHRQIGSWITDRIIQHWLEVHNEVDRRIKSWIYIHQAFLWLTLKNCQFYFLSTESIDSDFFTHQPSWASDIDFLPFNIKTIAGNYPLALDNKHPGPECHQTFAQNIIDFFNISY
jgi:hypothetical protein